MDQSGVMNAIVDWGNANGDKIDGAYNQKGGWEGWTQVELALHLKKVFQQQSNPGETVEVTREDKVYGTDQRSDLLLTTRKPNGDHFTNMIELKCESIANSANFSGQVTADCKKVAGGVINRNYVPCKAWVVAFSVTKNLSSLKLGTQNLKAYSKTIQAGGKQVTLWWGAMDFK